MVQHVAEWTIHPYITESPDGFALRMARLEELLRAGHHEPQMQLDTGQSEHAVQAVVRVPVHTSWCFRKPRG